MPAFSVSIPAQSRVLYLAHSSDESNDSVGVELAHVTLTHLPVDKLAEVGSVAADSFDFVLARPSLGYSPAFVASILRALRPGGSFVAHVPVQSGGASVQTQLVLGGFVDVAATPRDATVVEVVAQRPPWNVNASAPLKLKKKAPAPVPAPSTQAVWNLAASDMNELDADLADEDELLAKDTFVAPPPRVAADCGPGAGPTKKACKNCTCGLAEEQAADGVNPAAASSVAASKPVSACGSCGLGDAFRCSGCPFLGKPAFTMAPTGAVKLQL